MYTTTCLRVEGFGVAFGDRVVLAALDFELPMQSMTVLMGPSGCGKSTLLRALAGLHIASSRYAQWGDVEYVGQVLDAESTERPGLVQQNVKFLMNSLADAVLERVRSRLGLLPGELRAWCAEYVTQMGFPELASQLDMQVIDMRPAQQRVVAILREAAAQPALLLVDEPTSGLEDYEAFVVLDLLRKVQATSAVMVVLHNQRQARTLGGQLILMAGGHIQEMGDTDVFLDAPQTEVGRQFVRTGSCFVPAPDADPESLAEGVEPPQPLPAAAFSAMDHAAREQVVVRQGVAPASQGPRGFAWLLPGKLAGTPMPGVVVAMEHDLAALRRCGITMLITLTERDIDHSALQAYGLRNLHLPVHDREPPSVAQLQMLMKRMDSLMAKGEVLAVHCLAGIGRTGTVLASWLIYEGLTAQEALRRVRCIDAQYVQSVEQEQSLQQYEDTIVRKMN